MLPRSGCPINLTLEALGDRWSLIVIRDLMFGNRRHFRELLTRSEERIASNILTDRLTRLEKPELVSRRDDPSRARHVHAGPGRSLGATVGSVYRTTPLV
jgi:DNA-binding HxlR family transcriptional regulator